MLKGIITIMSRAIIWIVRITPKPVKIAVSAVVLLSVVYTIATWCYWNDFASELGAVDPQVWEYLYNLMD